MFTYVCQNIIRDHLFISNQDIIHSWFAFKFFSFSKIEFEKSILLPILIIKDYSIRNDIALSDLVCLILTKDEYKLPKQHILNDLWLYLSIGASLWNLKISTHFEFPIGTWNIFNIFVSCAFSWLWKVFFIEIRLTYSRIYLNTIKSNIKPIL